MLRVLSTRDAASSGDSFLSLSLSLSFFSFFFLEGFLTLLLGDFLVWKDGEGWFVLVVDAVLEVFLRSSAWTYQDPGSVVLFLWTFNANFRICWNFFVETGNDDLLVDDSVFEFWKEGNTVVTEDVWIFGLIEGKKLSLLFRASSYC